MVKIMFALHLLFAIFAIGPLVHAATTASRGIRRGDAAATAYSARMARIYAYVSVLVVVFGFGLMSSKEHGHAVAKFSDTWIWLSLLLWLVAVAVTLAVIAPSLDRATAAIGTRAAGVAETNVAGAGVGAGVAETNVPGRSAGTRVAGTSSALTARVAVAGGVVGLIFAAIVFLMVYQPGS